MEMLVLLGAVGGLLLLGVLVAMAFRRVVSANEVHIIQSARKTTSYGKDTESGNVYYEWPSSLPIFGVTKIVLPVSVFDLDLSEYEAYDLGRVPFVVDIKSFFRISNTNLAAQRVENFAELKNQLLAIVQGAVRTILAKSDIEEIMETRSKFGQMFTDEVGGQLEHWGVAAVKNIELMDIRDGDGDEVIHNIMQKKKSQIEMESRLEVAENLKLAQIKEISAKQEVDVESQRSAELVGLRTVEAQKKVELANQEAAQTVKEQQRVTKEKEMAVLKVQDVKTAEISKEVQIVNANQARETRVIVAQGELDSAKLSAEAQLELKRKESEGISLEGAARADAKQKMEVASVSAQIELAKEIGENEGYQKYLVTIRQVEATEAIGVKQAEALTAADIKVISNSSSAGNGIQDVSDMFSSKGGQQLGAMLQGLANTPLGKSALDMAGIKEESLHTSPVKKKSELNGSSKLNGSSNLV